MTMHSVSLKKAVSLVCALALMLCSVLMTGGAGVEAMTADEAKQKLQDLQDELIDVNKELAKAKDAIEEAKQRKNTYTKRVNIVKEQISILQESIDAKKVELSEKQAELDAKEREHDETNDLFKKRIRAMYMNNDVTTLSLILGSDSFSEFLVAAEMQSRISQHDTELIEKLQKEADAIALQKEVIEKELSDLESDMDTLEDKYSELAALLQEANEDLTAAEAYKKATEEEYDRVISDMQETQKEWNELMGTGMISYVGGYYAWPVPGFNWISSPFGWRTLYGQANWHGGIDIAGAGIYGKPILASNTGRVILVRYYTTGYGYHVMIDHGDDNWTVYGHMSSIAVSEGEWVAQGQVIGYVGSTGNSTGPHLHFEIRIDGERVDPLNYLNYNYEF
ncbi:MAG: peptidoglycan DD-metalloendopeptidase family protein [Oscillospiraceae bacterium]|nr:peptidoglycan DD-metalloendopeptidase family protein [Oscillospiraceae bacterium]